MINKNKEKEIRHTRISARVLSRAEILRGNYTRIECEKTFKVQGIPVVTYDAILSGRFSQESPAGPQGGLVQDLQSLDDTSWICRKAEVACDSFVCNESFIDGIAEIDGYSTLSHVYTSGITTIKHSYLHNCTFNGMGSVEFSELNRPINGKTGKVHVILGDGVSFDNVALEFTNASNLKKSQVRIDTIEPVSDVVFKLPVSKFSKYYVLLGNYAFAFYYFDIYQYYLIALRKMRNGNGYSTSKAIDYMLDHGLSSFKGKPKPPIVAKGNDEYIKRKGYDWTGTMIADDFAESRKHKTKSARNNSNLAPKPKTCKPETSKSETKKTETADVEKVDYDEKLAELKKKAQDLGIEL